MIQIFVYVCYKKIDMNIPKLFCISLALMLAMNLQAQDLTFHGNFHLFNVKAYQGWLSKLPDTIQLNGNVENASSVSDKSEDRSPRADIIQVKSFNLKVPMNPNAISVAEESVLRCAYLIMYSASEQFYWQHRNDGYNFSPKVPI